MCTVFHTVPFAGDTSGRAGLSDGLQGRHNTLPPIMSLKEAIYHVRDLLNITNEKVDLMDFKDVKALQRIKRK